jgi:predicted nucleic acid-binding protein
LDLHPNPHEGDGMNAIELLTDDHARLKKLMKRLEDTSDTAIRTREDLFTTIRNELTVHELVEEELFYPALKEHPRARDIVLEGYEEHHVVDVLLAEMTNLPFDDEAWAAKFTVMRENVEHHVEEEEDDMFKKARAVFDRSELEMLGAAMAARKAQAMGGPTPRPD